MEDIRNQKRKVVPVLRMDLTSFNCNLIFCFTPEVLPPMGANSCGILEVFVWGM